MVIKFEGYGYDWDAELSGGPCDGLVDRAVQLNGKNPPQHLVKILGKPMKQSKIGEKVIEDWRATNADGEKVAIYELTEHDEDENRCQYKYVETLLAKEYRDKYTQ